jgi:hypothetical protein
MVTNIHQLVGLVRQFLTMATSFCNESLTNNQGMDPDKDTEDMKCFTRHNQTQSIRQGQIMEYSESATNDFDTDRQVRNLSTLHVAFMSFVLASIPYVLAASLFYLLINGVLQP